ncbi:MAG: PRC-barrel domain-containing protein, partial [Planctomycetes bacterium]|nr:PRC-barrel domain-containing protein [Planctomycetota bacterium]
MFLSDLIGKKVVNASTEQTVGRITEVIAVSREVYPELNRVVLNPGRGKEKIIIPWSKLEPFELPVKDLRVNDISADQSEESLTVSKNDI